MKKLLLLLSALTVAISVVLAQNEEVTIVGSQNDEEITIEPNQRGDVEIKIGGYTISFGDKGVKQPKKRRSQFGREVDGKMGLIEFGGSMLTSPDYAGFNTATDGEFLSLSRKS